MRILFISISLLFFFSIQLNSETIIEIDNTKRFQVIDGWEAVANGLQPTDLRDEVMPHLSGLIDKAVNDVGITRLRLAIRSNYENTVDNFQLILDGKLTYDDYKKIRYEKINDNSDPFDADPNGFKFANLDYTMENIVIPFRNAVLANNDRFYLNLCFVDFKDQSEFHHSDDPEEYAEFMSYSWKYIDEKYNITPDGIEIILEPDNSEKWSATNLPAVLAATGDRLSNMGYNPEFIAPSLKSVFGIPNFFKEIAKNEKALSYLDVLSYHLYSGRDDLEAQAEIVKLANQHGLKTSMLEYDKNGNVNYLHNDLKLNNNVAWTKYALLYPTNEQWSYTYIENDDIENPEYEICTQTKYLRQYFKFIRPGAQRIDAIGGSNEIDPIAFENKDGNQVVVVKTTKADDLVIDGLKPGKYCIKYTLGKFEWSSVQPTHYDVDLEDIIISEGNPLEFNMPAQGVVTIYAKTTTSVISNDENKNIIISPNPINDKLNIYNLSKSSKVEIIDLNGSVLMSKTASASLEFDVSSLSSGSYIVRITGQRTGKVEAINIIIE